MEEEEKGISIGEIFKVIFKRIWWVVAVTAATLIAFVCVIQFWYNPSKQAYSASYDIRLPSDNTYPDGTVLRLEDSVLLENLKIIKDESLLPESQRTGKFANIDIEKMVSDDGIVFLQTIEKKEDETYAYHNTVRIIKKYFKNEKQASEFVKAVVEFPVNNAKKIVRSMNYSERLARFDKYLTYQEKIKALKDQKEYVEKMYEKIVELYSGEYVPAGLNSDKTIDDYIHELINVFDERQQEAVEATVKANYYEYDTETYKANAQARISSLEIAIADNERIIAELQAARNNLMQTGNIQATEAYEVRIADLTVANANMRNEKEKTKTTLDKIAIYSEGEGKAAKDAFDASLVAIRAQLEEVTQTFKSVNIATYEEKSQAIYVNNKIEVQGGLNIILAAVIGAVLGFVVVSAVILVIDLPKYKRAKLAAEAGAEQEGEQPEGEEKE